jgi:hypothetical protein
MAESCYVQLSGGRLGNQLFEIAAGYAHCKRNGYKLVLSRQGSKHWNTYIHKFQECIQRDMPPRDCVKWRQPSFGYSEPPAAAQFLMGYMQSSKFFTDVSGEIRGLFQPPVSIQEYVLSKYADLIAQRETATVIHVRRGDYFSIPKHRRIHGILGEPYYTRAITAAAGKGPLLVFSDDNNWCQKQSWLQGATFVDERNDCAALFLMTQFRRFIISNSSYSWWGAWLSGPSAEVWAPATWFGPAGPRDYQDVYEPTWSLISID